MALESTDMDNEGSAVGDLLWTPSEAAANASRIAHYLRWLNLRRARAGQTSIESYAELWRYSVDEIEAFWSSLWDYFEIGPRTFSSVLERREMPGAKWFTGATLNYVGRINAQRRDAIAVIHHDERGRQALLTYGELVARVAGCRDALQKLGVGPGDRVVGYVTNAPEALIAFLATASLGAIWSSCPPEFGVESVLDRFRQIAPKVLFACLGYQYGGKRFDRRGDVERMRAALGSLEACVWIGEPSEAPAPVGGQRALRFGDIEASDSPLAIEPVAFDHPLWILFSSGTTGLPKPIVHGHGGMLLEHLKVLALHSNLGEGDRFFWFSTTGWMMWNYLVSGLQIGATIVLYDGSPGYPDLSRLWRLAAEERVTYFGASAPFLMACKGAGIAPREMFDLSALRSVGSTGAPLPASGFDWVYRSVKSDVLLGSVSGGTDLCTAFVASCPLLPVYAGELQCRCLGAHVLAFDAAGEAVTGAVGELVIASPMPCMPVGFWNDPGGVRYRESYFDHFPGIWRHGDWILITERGSAVISGRSDATLNRGGVRMGTSEFYRVVEELDAVRDSVVVDTSDASGTGKLWLFVALRPGRTLDAELVQTIQRTLRSKLSPRHVPDEIRAIDDVPRTLSGKKLEVPIKRLLGGARLGDVVNPGTLQNPQALYGLLAAAGLGPAPSP
ncbi:MAG TPA: acetoacetate--CoA ligase [Polyangiaceae bacterium]|nr:acetoacetate--CoA ligase [Polyangiaceae bacterium]